MRDALFILIVIAILLAITAVKYRRQINGVIGFARMLKEAKNSIQTRGPRIAQPQRATPVQLVHCSKCGVWVPQTKATQRGSLSYCERCAST